MKIRLDRLGDEPLTWREVVELSAEALDRPELAALGGVACSGRIRRVTPGFLLQATLSYEQTLRCMRCLRPTAMPVEGEVDLLVLVDRGEGLVDEDQELESDELGVVHVEGPELDTDDVVREQVQLNVPMKPLCRDDCAGLCGTCGADRNQGPCSCGDEIDPRWAALAAFKPRSEG